MTFYVISIDTEGFDPMHSHKPEDIHKNPTKSIPSNKTSYNQNEYGNESAMSWNINQDYHLYQVPKKMLAMVKYKTRKLCYKQLLWSVSLGRFQSKIIIQKEDKYPSTDTHKRALENQHLTCINIGLGDKLVPPFASLFPVFPH